MRRGSDRASAERVNVAIGDIERRVADFTSLTDGFDKQISATIETVEQTVASVGEQSRTLNACAQDSNHRATTMAAAATEKILMMLVCSMLIKPMVASSRTSVLLAR